MYPLGQPHGVLVGVIDGVDIEDAELVLVGVMELVAVEVAVGVAVAVAVAELVSVEVAVAVAVAELVTVDVAEYSGTTGHTPQSSGQVAQPSLKCISQLPSPHRGRGQVPQSSKQLLQFSI
jgi:hypothetical protein